MALDSENLRLTDFLDLNILQEIQDSFAAIANVKATITGADGEVITQPAPTKEFLRRQRAIAMTEAEQQNSPQKEGREYVAPIMVNDQRLGTIRMTTSAGANVVLDESKLAALSEKYSIDIKPLKSVAQSLLRNRQAHPAAIQFLFLLANAIAKMCYQEFQLRQRINELTAVYNVATILSEARDLNELLQRTVQTVAETMNVKAASIRLVDKDRDELIIKAVYNLSKEYLNKGPIRLSLSYIDEVALSSRGYEFVRDLKADPRTQYPLDAAREGIVSMLSVGMRYKGKAVGVIRVYTEQEQNFSQLQIGLLRAVASQAAAAIENARLASEQVQAAALEKQVRMAADVQRRMIPREAPELPGIDIAAVYVPCYELGGDLYDFISLPENNVGLVIADVSGKGVPASLIMASVRAALRAQVDNVYYLYEIIRRLNLTLWRDTEDAEFVTLFYGVLNAATRRFTYCNAGHPPGLLLRDGKLTELTTDNMVLGVSPDEQYTQGIVELRSRDLILLYTDGLADAINFNGEYFGMQRIKDAFMQGGASADVVAQNILWNMRKFVGLTKRTDDVTMIVVRVL
ncbi:MAG TPA: SpoIIE family protein phosphatase [Tepidisphaeraceae bacterium]|jgi:sigma-B regulation protein RsbU (phosphoserine phosphatase)|nr:SpoIIE family protein phosphatase [Tepidisphaeraceae bacterium]